MKKQIIVTFVLLLCGLHSMYAQLQDQRHNFSVGFNGGVNINTVSFEPSFKQGKLMAPTFGLTGRYISEKYFRAICGLQVEVNFSQHGWKEDIDDGSGDSYLRKMNYIEVPFLAQLGFGKDKGHGVRFLIQAGPQVGFLLSEKEEKSASWHPEQRIVTEQYGKMADRKFDYGIAGGAGLEVRTGLGNFILEGRYYFGLNDFYNNTKRDYFGRSAHATIIGKLTYLFDLTN